ncbi:MAG: hypothetical protein ACI4J0_04975 [Huintestinicola sp.]|uniref:hypothetical protein n=1 Tax=Huintestinicola sp. TaxID=2981661 RepID=UPI003F0E1F34
MYNDKRFITNSEHPNDDFTGDADHVIPDGSGPAEKIIRLYPNFDFVFNDDGNITDVTETIPAPVPPVITIDDLAMAVAEIAAIIGGE